MAALTTDQLDLLQRAHDGVPMWGGGLATPRIRREVDLLLALGPVQPDGSKPYSLTALSEAVLAAITSAGRD